MSDCRLCKAKLGGDEEGGLMGRGSRFQVEEGLEHLKKQRSKEVP